jgi:hypothetical protein
MNDLKTKHEKEDNMTHIHLNKVEDIAGISLENATGGQHVKVLCRASLTSDDPDFYAYAEISDSFFSRASVSTSNVCRFLVLIHRDLSADLYINDFLVTMDIMSKRAIKKGEAVTQNDIADIRGLHFAGIKVVETDKVICCFKVGWKFGLFFDLNRRNKLDIDQMSLALGALYRYLSFQSVYKVLESEAKFDEMIRDGWFPFIEIIGGEYKTLSKVYQNNFGFADRINTVVDSFDKTRIDKIVNKWWANQIFRDKRTIIEAGVDAYLCGDKKGFINCIKNLSTEIEGIIRGKYSLDTSKENIVTLPALLSHLREKGRTKVGSDESLFLPLPFFKYLNDVIFANFDSASRKIALSRHSSSHGVARADDYTRVRALQMILTLDQIYFYIK